MQWFSDNWPHGLDWPSDIPRPDPAPDSPAANPPESEAPDEDVFVIVYRASQLLKARQPTKALPLYQRAVALAMRLDDSGHIADIEAFLMAVGHAGMGKDISRDTWHKVLQRWGDAAKTDRPLPRAKASSQFLALKAAGDSGDVRFTRYRERVRHPGPRKAA